jgi:hypothetical protein
LAALSGLVLFAGALLAQEGVQRGKIKKVDAEKGVLTLTVGGEDRDFVVTRETRLVGTDNNDIGRRLKDERFKEGALVMFKARERMGKSFLLGVKFVGDVWGKARVTADTSKLRPLTELGTDLYQGHEGGLYPGGSNERPAAHEAAGLRLAREVRPRAADGTPDAAGKIVLLSVGMSNTSQVSDGFRRLLASEKEVNPALLFVNGAQGGMTAAAIQDPDDGARGSKYWAEVDRRLKAAGVTRGQVQVVWIKQADAGPSGGFPAYARKLQEELANVVRVLPKRFPNVKLTYLSSRTYAGYATTRLNPEPYAYESGFSVKWLIEQQIKGDAALNCDAKNGAVKAPWLSWGPYFWANGERKRGDGHFFTEGDFAPDGTHLTSSGQGKTGGLLLRFLKTDATAKPWFLR